MAAKFCNNCAADIAEGARFCAKCGAAVGALPTGGAARTQTPAPPPAQPAAAYRPAGPYAAAPPGYPPTPYSYPAPAPYAGGYAIAGSAAMHQAAPHRTGAGLWLLLGGLLIGLVAVLAVVAFFLGAHPASASCGSSCNPPKSPPLGAAHTYTSSAFGWSVDWSDGSDLGAFKPTQDDHSINWVLSVRSGASIPAGDYPVQFTSEASGGRSASQVVDAIQKKSFPNATLAYTIPGQEVGYREGFGNVYDVNLASAGGQSAHLRLIVIAAVRNGVAVELISAGPYMRSSSDVDGHPNPSDTFIVDAFDGSLNTVRFKGDPIR